MAFLRNRYSAALPIAVVSHVSMITNCATVHPLPHGIFGADDRIPVDSSRWPWQAIGIVQRRFGGACSDTLIAPSVVLTAAHCTYDQRNRRALQAADLRFLTSGQLGQTAHTPSPSTIAGIVRPSLGHGQRNPTIKNMATDWALIVLRAPSPCGPSPCGLPVSPTANRSLVRDSAKAIASRWCLPAGSFTAIQLIASGSLTAIPSQAIPAHRCSLEKGMASPWWASAPVSSRTTGADLAAWWCQPA
ncbi:trypsin-like serine protease [Cyanobium sp. Tous-M-B4]|nr:trypsin-like serine protease [Cyanobium sp. Tous-M-B4]MCP9878012.1 trypsin-like serine protease [Cyanobium sp. A2C-AMD]